MKRLFTKIVSFLIASSVLFMSSTYAVEKHYCCNMLVDTSMFSSTKTCKDKAEQKDSPFKKCSNEDDSCCRDQVFVKKGESKLKNVNLELQVFDELFLVSFLQTYLNLFEGLSENIIPFKNYVPPLISKNILELHETYLI